jgi:hypothetical protein
LQFVAEWPKGLNRRIAVALSKSEKEKIVGEVKEVASNASSLVLSDARGLKVSELSEVRQKGKTLRYISQAYQSLCRSLS